MLCLVLETVMDEKGWENNIPSHSDGNDIASFLSGSSGVVSSGNGSESSGDGEELHVD
jgi:hypothetical protein